jgi:UDP-2,3-diacylglucosamine pyrophosphatase LpxH
MLVFISDLHLNDETFGATIPAGAFRSFREALHDLAYTASWREGGKYKPLERLDLVLLGDIFDVLRTEKWLEHQVRPWDNPVNADLAAKVEQITTSILRRNQAQLDYLASLHDPRIMSLPVDGDRGKLEQPESGSFGARAPLEVRVHYMVGNQDWLFHLPHEPYHQTRRAVTAACGLCNPFDQPFPHDPTESPELMRVMEQHQVMARHGDVYDPLNYDGARDASSLGDAIMVELLSRFFATVKGWLEGALPPDFVSGLAEIANVRPLYLVPVWIEGFLRRTCPEPEQVRRIKQVWDDLVDEFLRLPLVRHRDQSMGYVVDRSRRALQLSNGVSLGDIARLANWWEGQSAPREWFYRNALRETSFKSKRAQYFVYGHTHRHEIIPLDVYGTGSAAGQQLVFNSGTWRKVHEFAKRKPTHQDFVAFESMSYLAFFKGDERGGHPYESWSGTLGGIRTQREEALSASYSAAEKSKLRAAQLG